MAKLGLRKAYGEALLELGKQYENVAVVAADLSKSTEVNRFAETFPKRFFNVGVSEEDAVSLAAGLAADGEPVFLSTFAVFGVYLGLGQIIQSICLNRLPVKLVFTHGGINVGPDGASHQALQDIAVMRSLPNMKVIIPADYYETKAAVKTAIEIPGPVYIRLPRESGEVIYNSKVGFSLGEAKLHFFGEEPAVLIISCGLLVAEALKVAKILYSENIPVLVVNMSSIKPLDPKLSEWAERVKHIFTLEDHSVIGGLGGAVAEVLSQQKYLGIPDCFGESGSSQELLEKFGLTESKIIETIKSHL